MTGEPNPAGAGPSTVVLPPDAAGWRVDRALAAALPALSRERLKALVAAGRVTGEGGPWRDPARKVAGGERLTVDVPAPAPAAAAPQPIALAVPYEDEHLLVVDKPAGLVVHPACGNPDGTLVNALLHHCAGRLSGIGGVARPGIVHRIDKDTSGLLVVAKTDRAHEGLARQFARHRVERIYTAVVAGRPVPAAGRIAGALGRSPRDRQKMSVVEEGRGKAAVTHYRTIELLDGAAVTQARLETGRTHQVRVHMSSIGHPLLGDPVYRARGPAQERAAALGFARQALHAGVLGFVHPVEGTERRFVSPTPADMTELISALRFNPD